jgi:hypothetical protein
MPEEPIKLPAKPFKPLPHCRYIMPTGRRCRSIRLKRHPWACYFHAPLSVRRGGTDSPLPFSRMRATERELLLAARDRLRQQLPSSATGQRDRVLLRGLQMALEVMNS